MDGFVAVIRLDGDSGMAPPISASVTQAMIRACQREEGTVTTRMDDDVAFACWMKERVTDSLFQANPGDGWIYVNGPVVALPEVREPGFPSDDQERRAALVAAAIDGSVDLTSLSGSFHGFYSQPASKRVVAITDRLGSRPIFACSLPGLLCLASHIRLLLTLPGVRPVIERESLAQYVRNQEIFENRTLYRDINILTPATVLDVNQGIQRMEKRSYWSLAPNEPFQNREEAIGATARAFSAATVRLLDGSHQTGLLLSGGMDSRMLLACATGSFHTNIRSRTFGSELTEEARTARKLSEISGIEWDIIEQNHGHYWENMHDAVGSTNGLYLSYHGHTFYPSKVLVSSGVDTALNGWAIDGLFSGSYFPKKTFNVAGRQIYSYRLGEIRDKREALSYLLKSFDIQKGIFEHSCLQDHMHAYWKESSEAAVGRLLNEAVERSSNPYDWIDFVLWGSGICKFRSFPMVEGIRFHLRERNPLFESDVLDVYRRLPPKWRYLGPVFRRALLRLNSSLARVPYANIGASAFAPPVVQAISLQTRTAWRANKERIARSTHRLGMATRPPRSPDGAYPSAATLAAQLSSPEFHPAIPRIRRLLFDGPLVEARIVRRGAVAEAIDRAGRGQLDSGYTVLALASLALWLDSYPFEMP